MPEGLTNAPAAFQMFMNDTFVDMIDINTVVYLEDILIYSDGLPKHITHVWEYYEDFTSMASSPEPTNASST